MLQDPGDLARRARRVLLQFGGLPRGLSASSVLPSISKRVAEVVVERGSVLGRQASRPCRGETRRPPPKPSSRPTVRRPRASSRSVFSSGVARRANSKNSATASETFGLPREQGDGQRRGAARGSPGPWPSRPSPWRSACPEAPRRRRSSCLRPRAAPATSLCRQRRRGAGGVRRADPFSDRPRPGPRSRPPRAAWPDNRTYKGRALSNCPAWRYSSARK